MPLTRNRTAADIQGSVVVPGLVPGIHDFFAPLKDVDGRDSPFGRPGHDAGDGALSIGDSPAAISRVDGGRPARQVAPDPAIALDERTPDAPHHRAAAAETARSAAAPHGRC